ncbi:MAG TPA: biotin/lipoyl-binding protein [Verrucomicrobiae bacterium]|nr:biotin/lipoyl-binding protein [Verrucomicrobiae bacterium]
MQKVEDTTYSRPPLRDQPSLRWRRWLDRWPIAAWAGIAVIAVAFYVKSTQYGALPGSAQTMEQDLSPIATARVQAVFVKIGDNVTNGQILAQMDTTIVDFELAEAEAALAAAEGSWAGYEEQMLDLLRDCNNDIAGTEAAVVQVNGQLDSDTAKLAELKPMQAKRDALFANKLITEIEDDELRPEIAGLEKDVVACGQMIKMDETTLANCKKERDDLQQGLKLAPGGDIKQAIAQKTAAQTEILQNAVEMKKREKESYSLRSWSDGIVSAIGIYPGSTAKPGDSVVSVVSGNRLIIGYLPEVSEGMVKVGDTGYAFELRKPPIKVKVVAVAPEIDGIPAPLRPATAALQSGVTFRAQRIVFQVEGPENLIPGESVQIRLTTKFWADLRYMLGLQW